MGGHVDDNRHRPLETRRGGVHGGEVVSRSSHDDPLGEGDKWRGKTRSLIRSELF